MSRPEDAPPRTGDRILVVEDEPDARRVLVALLEAHGYRVLAAEHGREALDRLAAAGHVCLILLDLRMPQMDGWSFRAEQMRRPEHAGIPVVVVSADRDVEERAREMNAEAALRKPIELSRLLEIVHEHCAGC